MKNTMTFTIDQIKDIYRAGMRRGESEASAYEWGSSATGSTFDECVDAIHNIVNDGVNMFDDRYIEYDVVEAWFKD